jgi:tetratricopeptide (TPR) repeat protein
MVPALGLRAAAMRVPRRGPEVEASHEVGTCGTCGRPSRELALVRGASGLARLGRLLERAKKPASAVEAYRDALKLEERHLPARNALAILLARSEEAGEARSIARRSVEWFPRSAQGHLVLGLVDALDGDKEAALPSFVRALDLAGDRLKKEKK